MVDGGQEISCCEDEEEGEVGTGKQEEMAVWFFPNSTAVVSKGKCHPQLDLFMVKAVATVELQAKISNDEFYKRRRNNKGTLNTHHAHTR